MEEFMVILNLIYSYFNSLKRHVNLVRIEKRDHMNKNFTLTKFKRNCDTRWSCKVCENWEHDADDITACGVSSIMLTDDFVFLCALHTIHILVQPTTK